MKSRVWEETRRALGHLLSRAVVRELAAEMMPIHLRKGDMTGAAPVPGSGERAWKPTANVAVLTPPEARAGQENGDLSVVGSVISLNAAEWACAQTIHALALPIVKEEAGRALATSRWQSQTPAVSSQDMEPAGGEMRQLDAFEVRYPATERLSGERLRLAGGRVRSGASVMAGVPLTRLRQERLPERAGQKGITPERRLALAAKASLADVQLVGIYYHIPVVAVRRLSVSPDGHSLSFWLKPEALSAARMPQVSLIIGRLRSTGKIIQAVA